MGGYSASPSPGRFSRCHRRKATGWGLSRFLPVPGTCSHPHTKSRSSRGPRSSNRYRRLTLSRPSNVFRCQCGARWIGLAAAHCSACHRTFSGPALFDRHRAAYGEHGTCLDPTELRNSCGYRVMFLRDGMWRGPEMTEERKKRFGDSRLKA